MAKEYKWLLTTIQHSRCQEAKHLSLEMIIIERWSATRMGNTLYSYIN